MRVAIRLALALYPRWWRERYGREMNALLEDSSAGWTAAFDLARGAVVVRIEDGMKRASMSGVRSWLGRNALALVVSWMLAFALIQGGARLAILQLLGESRFAYSPMIGRFIAYALSATISYKLRASFMMGLLATLAGFYGSWLIFSPIFDVALYEGGVALYERPPIDFGRMAVSIVGATLAWWAVRPARRRLKVAL